MKRLFILAVFITSFSGAIAQNKELSRTIEVTGIAETEVTPDIIDVSISLQEYMDGRTRITIIELEQQLKKAVEKAGIRRLTLRSKMWTDGAIIMKEKRTPPFWQASNTTSGYITWINTMRSFPV